MNTRSLENAIEFAKQECKYEMSECVNNQDMETWKILEEVKNKLQEAIDVLPF